MCPEKILKCPCEERYPRRKEQDHRCRIAKYPVIKDLERRQHDQETVMQELNKRLDKLEQKEAHDFNEVIKSIEALQVQIEEISARITQPEFLPVKKSSHQLKLATSGALRLLLKPINLKEYDCYTA